MKYFFWLSGLAYVFVYFYAAWIYDGFSMPVAIIVFLLSAAFVYWRYKRHLADEAQLQSQIQNRAVDQASRKPMSIWRSPFPYVGIIALIAIVVGFQI
ncbi:hypothetical protein ACFO4O_03565 [Glaciecola siphonariae]|uniref:Uncharacterized protein n=1 Tax=Glaciecola siphonariae TaxID=521012 RepID=A0ABV9LSS6_9ALTE